MFHMDLWLSMVCGAIVGGALWAALVLTKRAMTKGGSR